MQALEHTLGTSNSISLDSYDYDQKSPSDLKLAIDDVIDGLKQYKLWIYLSMTEMRRRYRRTVIGPFWTTLSLGLFIFCMGFLLSALWKYDLKSFLPYFCSGYICWMIVQSVIVESGVTFTSSSTFIRQISLPYTLYACLVTYRNVLVLFHHLVIWFIVMCLTGTFFNFYTLLFIPGLVVIFFTSIWVSILLGMICARYRDVQQIIASLLQLAMFVTPIMWRIDQIGSRGAFLVNFNPLFHFISIIRLPLSGEAPTLINWTVSIVLSALGAMFTIWLLAKKYRRLVFWL